MAKCPACEHDVATPFFLNMDAWRWLTCPHCAARIERKDPRLVGGLMGFWLALIALGTLGHRYRIIAEVLMVVIFIIILLDFMRPQLQLRKPLPKPETTLNLSGPSH